MKVATHAAPAHKALDTLCRLAVNMKLSKGALCIYTYYTRFLVLLLKKLLYHYDCTSLWSLNTYQTGIVFSFSRFSTLICTTY